MSVPFVSSYEVATMACHCAPCNKMLIFFQKKKRIKRWKNPIRIIVGIYYEAFDPLLLLEIYVI